MNVIDVELLETPINSAGCPDREIYKVMINYNNKPKKF